jgi:GTP-binding protein
MTGDGPAGADDAALAEEGRRLFAGEAEFFWAAGTLEGLPPIKGVEVAFAGRSNVGKSSLVNALTGRKTLARTSHTPGRTQQLNFFDIGGRFTLVDMPGYGYAAVSKQKVASWTDLVNDYLRGRASLARVFLLIDARHGLKPNDIEVLDALDRAAVSYQLLLTKADELKPAEVDKRRLSRDRHDVEPHRAGSRAGADRRRAPAGRARRLSRWRSPNASSPVWRLWPARPASLSPRRPRTAAAQISRPPRRCFSCTRRRCWRSPRSRLRAGCIARSRSSPALHWRSASFCSAARWFWARFTASARSRWRRRQAA